MRGVVRYLGHTGSGAAACPHSPDAPVTSLTLAGIHHLGTPIRAAGATATRSGTNPARRPNRRRGRQAAGVTGVAMPETMIGTAVEQAEAKVRRLMAQRAAIPLTWETRARRAELYREILAALEEHAGCE